MTQSQHPLVPANGGPLLALGLDLGVSSLGWALLELNRATQEPIGVRALGVRIFPAGVDGDVESGREESRGVKRRDRRLQRRQLWRRARRDASVFHALQSAGLLPPGNGRDPESRHALLLTLDAQIAQALRGTGVPEMQLGERLLHTLRARALDVEVPAFFVGRALYHLGQRRGFLSNRIVDANELDAPADDDLGKVKGGIKSLADEMAEAKARTLGEYLATRSSDEGVRRRYTARQMLKDEFAAIWEAQQPHHAIVMTDVLRDAIHRAILRQRPLKSQRHLVARCELEPKQRRAMIADPLYQEFRILQKVNDLRVELSEFETRGLSSDERVKLVEALTNATELTFAAIRKLLTLPKSSKFNLERGGEKRLIGNRTRVRLHTALGDHLAGLPSADHERLISLLLFCDKEETIRRVGVQYLGLDAEKAHYLSLTTLEPGTAALSRRALRKLNARMRDGIAFATAKAQEYPALPVTARNDLPPVATVVRSLRNPAVLRTLTELRHVVNAIVKRYGTPDLVRIELARDMKRPRKVRQEMSKTMREREAERTHASSQIEKDLGITHASRADIERYLLWKECNCTCPYTGQRIGLSDLIGTNPTVDVEHIIPYAVSLDDSFANKTLCIAGENRNVKRRQSPWEAYSGDADRWNEILSRVDQFRGTAARRKKQLFRMETIPSEFADRQLNDTRHASVLAQDYVGLLYGGAVDSTGRRRVQASSGGITAHVRRAFNLSQLLGGDGEKTRSDHRHHAVDAVAIAATTPYIVELLQTAARRASARPGRTPKLPEITDGMRDAVGGQLAEVLVSHRRPSGDGALHDESLYGQLPDGSTVIRKSVLALNRAAIDDIVDPVVRTRVLAAVGDGDPAKVFANENWPTMPSGIPIKRVRIRKSDKLVPVGTGPRQRLVKPNGNSHLELFISDKGDKLQWRIVSRLDAYRRRATDGSSEDRTPPADGWRFLTTLRVGELLEREVARSETDETEVLILENISKDQIELKLHRDARTAAERRKLAGSRIVVTTSSFLRGRFRKLSIDALGHARRANA
jgi:CRISPR-associated endonuclease Csn1